MNEINLKKMVDEIVEKYFNDKCTNTCKDSYYKNQYLKYAIENHNSLQTIGRTYAEALYTGYSKFTHRKSDLYHGNQILTYLQNYIDTSKLDYLASLLTNFLEKLPTDEDYIIFSCFGREKSFRSVEAKIRHKILMTETLNELIDNFNAIESFSSLSENNKIKAKKILDDLLKDINSKTPTKDLFGIRFIIDKIGKNDCSEKDLISFCYQLGKRLVDFFEENGLELLEKKDYIAKPKKDTCYQSLHLVFEIFSMQIEIQIRTSAMHHVAEYGTANHEKVYKDTMIQNFTRNFMYDLSKGSKLVSNENNCLLKSFNFFEKHISKTPNCEIPSTPYVLNCANDVKFIEFLKQVHENN